MFEETQTVRKCKIARSYCTRFPPRNRSSLSERISIKVAESSRIQEIKRNVNGRWKSFVSLYIGIHHMNYPLIYMNVNRTASSLKTQVRNPDVYVLLDYSYSEFVVELIFILVVQYRSQLLVFARRKSQI